MKDTVILKMSDGTEKSIKFYSSTKSLPIKRYQLVQKYTLIDAAVGSTFDDVLRHFNRLDTFIEANDMESVAIERENMLMNYNFMLSEEYIRGYVFASMIKSVDGVDVEIDDDNIEDYVDMLEQSDINIDEVEELVDAQKKSLMRSFY